MCFRFHLVALIIIAGTALGCAGANGPTAPDRAPVSPSDAYGFVRAGENTAILGAWRVLIDPLAGRIEAVPLRSLEVHVNVTKMVTPPKCTDCFLAKNLSYDPVTQIVVVDIGFRNPTGVTGYDVRGIITEFGPMEFLNPDGYTELFSPMPGEIHPFVAYDTGVGQRAYPGYSSYYETLEIHNPQFPKFVPLSYVVEASWPENCKEPYEVLPGGVSGDLYSDGSNTQILQVVVHDWLDDVSTVTVDLAPIGGPVVPLEPSGTFPDTWQGEVFCAEGTPAGEHDVLVCAETAPPYDQTALMYNYVTLRVKEPAPPQVEVFGPPERLTWTPGESFVWPRHAIAVTSDGIPHAVWVDNSPDPESSDFHVYYSRREETGWTVPSQIDDDAGRAIYATIAGDPSDVLHVIWEDERSHVLGSDVYYATSEDDFETESVLADGDDGFRNVHPRIESGNDGTLHTAWHSLDLIDMGQYEYDIWYMRRPAGAPGWESAVSVVSEEGVAEAYPAIAPAPDGAVYLAYQSDASGPHGIYFSSNASGDFMLPVVVTVSDAYQPALDVAPSGSLLLAYFDYVDGTYTDIYLRFSYDAGQTWQSPLAVSESNEAYQIAPDVECTAEGDFHIAWHEEDDMGWPRRVLYREYVEVLGWQDIVEIVGYGGTAAFPSMDGDGDGHIHMIYEQLVPVEPPGKDNYEIWYRSSVPD